MWYSKTDETTGKYYNLANGEYFLPSQHKTTRHDMVAQNKIIKILEITSQSTANHSHTTCGPLW